jgi:hypothetical protein
MAVSVARRGSVRERKLVPITRLKRLIDQSLEKGTALQSGAREGLSLPGQVRQSELAP